MMKSFTKSQFNIKYGTIIQGKWHQNSYKVIRELGSGANGTVYLVDFNGNKAALKISFEPMTVTSEVNVLKSFSKAQGVTLGPSLLDVDDWVIGTQQYSFYVMEYVEGVHLIPFIRKNGMTWLPILILQLLKDLGDLHKQGWVFGDLKPDNLIVAGPPIKIRCIDVGGTTPIGRAIKEYTEFFDRGYWGLGSRKSEPSYDLFAIGMIMINSCYPQRFLKKEGGIQQLTQAIDASQELRKYKSVLIKALTGKYQTADAMRKDLLKILNGQTVSDQKRTVRRRSYNYNQTRQRKSRRSWVMGVIETILIFILISLLYVYYILGNIF
ncbi:protein kinase domain-containing protein [Pallidibacillus pasinlerensis]|uniref:Serine/threonine protein kinase n=1 Tax=Pallidibacillus pasinlerensis TaxID=2703818 RepID=A0ABX0A4I1_9BACI|nr:serine/threonine-protein kinase [Pallidibacillus pasinlerensis]NCU17732.1 serine/threonine protein kinase [Pallidibacillus pasinlerensis]